MDERDDQRERAEAGTSATGAPDENVHLWGRDLHHEDFAQADRADGGTEPTPPDGQAGIAQGNVFDDTTRAAQPPRGQAGERVTEDTFATRDQFTATSPASESDLSERSTAARFPRTTRDES
jgi:hypothetical protein